VYYVYVLLSKKDNNIYTGFTSDLRRRIKEHKLGKVKSTDKRRPLELIYYETYKNKNDAKHREKYLKSGGKAKNTLKLQITKSLGL